MSHKFRTILYVLVALLSVSLIFNLVQTLSRKKYVQGMQQSSVNVKVEQQNSTPLSQIANNVQNAFQQSESALNTASDNEVLESGIDTMIDSLSNLWTEANNSSTDTAVVNTCLRQMTEIADQLLTLLNEDIYKDVRSKVKKFQRKVDNFPNAPRKIDTGLGELNICIKGISNSYNNLTTNN